jgi:hypothetical protein
MCHIIRMILYSHRGSRSRHPEALRSFPTPQPALDFARMYPVHDEHDEEHQHGVENINVHLVLEKWAVETIGELDQTEYRPNKNEQACGIQRCHMPLPTNIDGSRSWALVHTPVEDGCGEDEDGEETDLNPEAYLDYCGA